MRWMFAQEDKCVKIIIQKYCYVLSNNYLYNRDDVRRTCIYAINALKYEYE